jgi:hypothetical protein
VFVQYREGRKEERKAVRKGGGKGERKEGQEFER